MRATEREVTLLKVVVRKEIEVGATLWLLNYSKKRRREVW